MSLKPPLMKIQLLMCQIPIFPRTIHHMKPRVFFDFNDNDVLNNLNKLANDYDDISTESTIFENTKIAMLTINEPQSTNIITSTDIRSTNEVEMETADRNDYYVSLEDQTKISRENKRAHYNCQKPDFENVILSPAVKIVNSHNDIKNDTHK